MLSQVLCLVRIIFLAVFANLKKRTQERYMLEAGYTKLNIDGASISLNGL